MDIWRFEGCCDKRLQFYQLFTLVLSLPADHENMQTFSAIRGFCWKKRSGDENYLAVVSFQ